MNLMNSSQFANFSLPIEIASYIETYELRPMLAVSLNFPHHSVMIHHNFTFQNFLPYGICGMVPHQMAMHLLCVHMHLCRLWIQKSTITVLGGKR